MNKRIAIIGASDLQLPLIEKAKQMGYETHVFAWAAGDVGEKAADHFYPISIIEIGQILDVCREIRPVAVASIASDLAAITVNRVANALGLPANPVETATIATNKYEMRKTFLQAGLPTPRFLLAGPEDDLGEARRLRLPIIVKPTDRSGSRGIFKLESFDRLEECVAVSCHESFEKKAIIEEYIEGEEYSCECVSQDGVHHFLAITKKFTTGAPHFIETGHMEPSGLSDSVCEQVKRHVFKALDALHVRCGASHSEFKITPDTGEVRLIEIGARMGGDCIGSDLVKLSTGNDFLQMVIEAAAGEKISLGTGEPRGYAAVRYIMNETDYEGYLEIRKAEPGRIIREHVHFEKGGEVLDSSTRYGFYIVTGASEQEARRLAMLRP